MKVLALNGYFLLPDSFKGSYEDAIREYLKYRKACGYGPNPRKKNVMKGTDKLTQNQLWARFLKITKKGKRFCGTMNVAEFKAGKWVKLYKAIR